MQVKEDGHHTMDGRYVPQFLALKIQWFVYMAINKPIFYRSNRQSV
jgi:hypothetical protein